MRSRPQATQTPSQLPPNQPGQAQALGLAPSQLGQALGQAPGQAPTSWLEGCLALGLAQDRLEEGPVSRT
jgi:hypothetical protein